MQLVFPNGEHRSIAFKQGEIRIGSQSDQEVCLVNSSLRPHHARLVSDQSGLWLKLPEKSSGVHVNARPVSRLAWLRVGDHIFLEQVHIVVRQSEFESLDQKILPEAPSHLPENQRINTNRVVLRAVSGSQFGRCFSLAEPKVIGRAQECNVRIDGPTVADRHAQIELHGDQIIFRGLSSSNPSFVNGVAIEGIVLAAGDQIAIDQHRFVLEAPGLLARGRAELTSSHVGRSYRHAMQPLTTSNDELVREKSDSRRGNLGNVGALWRLLAAAALLAVILTTLLVYAPQFGV